MTHSPYTVYQDKEQWIPFLNWFWLRPGQEGMGQGPFPAKWIAKLSAWWHTR